MSIALGGPEYAKIINDGLEAERRRNAAKMAELLAAGVDRNEAFRQVYMPCKSIEEWDDFNREYESAFALPKLKGEK